jgi:alkyl sulfatase BDS1-like metallo-beta-lactamase superfamily hydrolase
MKPPRLTASPKMRFTSSRTTSLLLAATTHNYRWAIQVLHHLVFADPDDTEAKELQADTYEQLGYQQEVPQYRAIFLTAAKELRRGCRQRRSVQHRQPGHDLGDAHRSALRLRRRTHDR